MSKHSTIRNVIAAAAVSTVIGLTSLAGGAASADGPSNPGREYIYWTVTLTNPAVSQAPVHKATDVTMKRGIIGGFKPMSGASESLQCAPVDCGSNSPITNMPLFT